jgi:hypothetical protein
MSRDEMDFYRDLIKGRIDEVIFEQMFREEDEFTILRLGYEYTSPELAQYRDRLEVRQVLDNIKNTPDFALISHNKKRLFIVEVKYRSRLEKPKLKRIAAATLKFADPSWLFVATPDGFFFDACNNVFNHSGEIRRLQTTWIPQNVQDKYIKLLNEFRL